jgi:hypothetical protein
MLEGHNFISCLGVICQVLPSENKVVITIIIIIMIFFPGTALKKHTLISTLTHRNQVEFISFSIGKYMYIEATYQSTGDNAKLQLAVPRGKSSSCLTFFYHMYGRSTGTLNVFNGNVKIFTKSGNQGNYWKKVSRTLHLSDVVSLIDILFIQRFRVVYDGIPRESLVFSRYTYTKKIQVTKWDIPWYTTRQRC